MSEKKTKYSDSELKEFETNILNNISEATTQIKNLMGAVNGQGENSIENAIKTIEDGSIISERDSYFLQAERQRQFIGYLEDALVRIKNGTYGICIITGELIEKERLMVVPHTRHSLAGKLIAQANQ
jgi:DnaK suppressor protein